MSARIDIEGISKNYGSFAALDNVSLALPAGGFTVLLGPSGSGKTTLLSVLGGFTTPEQGRVLIDGKDVTHLAPATRPTTTVFQDYALFPHMTIGENIGFGLRMRKINKSERDVKAANMLALVGLPDAYNKKPHQLSGGQRQRVALARALAVEPQVLLLDEPLGALDLKLRRQMQDELKQLQRRVGTTFIHVTHDQEEAMAIADTIVVLNKGRIEDHGSPDQIYRKPKTRFVAEFMGLASLIEGKVQSQTPAQIVVDTALGKLTLKTEGQPKLENGQNITLSLRPEDIVLGQTDGSVDLGQGTIQSVTFLGPHCKFEVIPENAPATSLIVLTGNDCKLRIGDKVPLSFRDGAATLLSS